MTPERYDTIGRGYARRRIPDEHIGRSIRRALGDAASVLNVGAGTGSYEPADIPTVAVEPSHEMIRQRHDLANAVQARAEALPFRDAAFDAVLAILTVHHWSDPARGLRECARVARRRVVIFTWDPDSSGFWLTRHYVPEIFELDRRTFPRIDDIRRQLGPASVETVPIPADCTDGFAGAYWRRPQAYLDPDIRSGMSCFARIGDVSEHLARLRQDLDSGAWQRAHAALLEADSIDLGYRLVIADGSQGDRRPGRACTSARTGS